LFGQPELAVLDVAVGPDGRVSFLEAQDILATGLTIDELRARMDEELGKYHRAPHTLVTPVAFRSKRYYMLGQVMAKGAYVLDRPLTVLEAIARARGFESGLVNRSVVDVTDFSRSFVARNGKRIPLNFEKLFQSGDLSQNLPVEPGDYIYIAAANAPEVYVVGEVRLPGPVAYGPNQTIISAITARGGFTQRAWHSRVLVVRGSLNKPDCFAVDTAAIVSGQRHDFKLQPRDIIFVSHRPFARVEELADLATTAFIQGLITAWVDVKVVKPFVTQ
jgi:protein involved in polysaccharide export with SLBB domain